VIVNQSSSVSEKTTSRDAHVLNWGEDDPIRLGSWMDEQITHGSGQTNSWCEWKLVKDRFEKCTKDILSFHHTRFTFDVQIRAQSATFGEQTCSDSSSLQSVSIPSSIKTISASCYTNCGNPTSIFFDSSCQMSVLLVFELGSQYAFLVM
jgi:hypothetical protein